MNSWSGDYTGTFECMTLVFTASIPSYFEDTFRSSANNIYTKLVNRLSCLARFFITCSSFPSSWTTSIVMRNASLKGSLTGKYLLHMKWHFIYIVHYLMTSDWGSVQVGHTQRSLISHWISQSAAPRINLQGLNIKEYWNEHTWF